MNKLPIYEVLDDIKLKLSTNNNLILQAPPGAGKSTIVPISLLDEPWLENKMIIMLEPRRVAARMVASVMAKLLNEKVGQSVGYQIKMDSCFSKETKLLIVTEAILVRKLQSDQSLEDVAMIIFDEFHERSIHTDLSLALSLQVQELLRDDLKLLIMSATLNSDHLLKLLGNVPVITSHGKVFDVENIYLKDSVKQPDFRNINNHLLEITINSLKNDEGDILVFLAGTKEIKNLQNSLIEKLKNNEIKNVEILPLYSSLSKKEQDKAIEKSTKRKVILSTNIAQTSLTIEGVKVVIDSGLKKLSQYDYSNGMNHLNLSFISNDSAVQRAGRAGRLSNGKCYKLWHEKKILQKSTKPEILRSDLSSFFLEISLWGIEDIKELKLLDYPDEHVQNSTQKVLNELKMLDDKNHITSFGSKALSLGIHPRFAFMILKANELGFAYEAYLIASFLSEKDIFKDKYSDVNIYSRFIHLAENKSLDFNSKNILKQAEFYFKKLKAIENINTSNENFDEEKLAIILLYGYPDRLAKQRNIKDNKYKLSNAKGAILNIEDGFFNEEFLIVPSLNAQNKDSYINLAARISLATIEEYFSDNIKIKETITYNRENKKFGIREVKNYFELELSSKALAGDTKHDYASLICELIKKEGLNLLSWSKKAINLKDRVNFIDQNLKDGFVRFDDEILIDTLEDWLKPFLDDVQTIKELEALDLYTILLSSIPWEKQQQLDKLAPTHIKVPSGSNIKIDYSNKNKPILAVKIQEMFGMHETPKILNNKVSLQIHLLSPALRPIQITYDLKSFWENSYEDVKKELFSKYKKHYWPDNPFEAIATNKTKKNMNK